MRVEDVLAAAKSIVDDRWYQGHFTDGRGNYCLRVAIGIAAGVMKDTRGLVTYNRPEADALPVDHAAYFNRVRVEQRALDAVVNSLPEPFGCISIFNDDSQTTRNDVLSILDKAITSVKS